MTSAHAPTIAAAMRTSGRRRCTTPHMVVQPRRGRVGSGVAPEEKGPTPTRQAPNPGCPVPLGAVALKPLHDLRQDVAERALIAARELGDRVRRLGQARPDLLAQATPL